MTTNDSSNNYYSRATNGYFSTKPTSTPAINTGELVKKITIFSISIIIITIVVCMHTAYGSLILFSCKIAQSSILPTNTDCMPYTSVEPSVSNDNINIFASDGMSQKIQFPYNEKTPVAEYNKKNMIINFLRGIKESNKSSFLTNYFISIIDELFCLYYSLLDFIYSTMNQTFPEYIIVMLGPFIMPVMFFIMTICGWLYSIYLWFIEMKWFFKVNENKSKQGPPKWETMSVFHYPIYMYIAVVLVFIFVFLFFMGGGVLLNMALFVCFNWALISMLGYKGVINGQEVGIFNIIKDVFKYHKIKIMSMIALFTTISAFINMGAVGGVVCLVTIVLLFFGIFIHSNIFKNDIPPGMSEVSSYLKAAKKCDIKVDKSLFTNISNAFGNLFS